MPYFSIALPVYNVEKYLPKCLDTILAQTFTDFEVICVNDCSTDSSLKILEQYQKKDSRIKIFNNEDNKGISVVRNKAMDMACGEYLVWVDSDDWVKPEMLEVIYNTIQKTGHDVIWYDSYWYKESDNTEFLLYSPEHSILKKEGYYDVTPENLHLYTDFVWNKVMKLSLLRSLNIRFPEGLIFEDCEFYFKVYTKIKKIYYIDKPLYCHYEREWSLCTTCRVGFGTPLDMFDILENVVDYAQANNIFYDYRMTILRFMDIRIYSQKLPNNKEAALIRSDKLLKKINFPEAFADLENNQPEASMIFIK